LVITIISHITRIHVVIIIIISVGADEYAGGNGVDNGYDGNENAYDNCYDTGDD